VQALFAVNERWFINERGSVEAVDSMTVKPEGFSEVASRLLGCPGQDSVALARSFIRGVNFRYPVEVPALVHGGWR